MLSQVFPGPDIGAILENPSLASTEKQVDFDACHWLGMEPWYCQSWIGYIKSFLCGTVGLFDQNLVPTFPCLKKSSLFCCHLWQQKYLIQSPLWSQRPKSDFNFSPPTAEAFLLAASHRVIADAESESVGLSTLRHNFNAPVCMISTTSTASPQKPAAEQQCLGKMCQQNRVGGVSRVGHINGEPWEEESRTSQGSLPDINVAFVSTLLLPRCKRCEPEWLSTRTQLQIRLANQGIFCPEQPFGNRLSIINLS